MLKAFYLLHSLLQTIWFSKLVFYSAVVAGCVIAFSPPEAGLQPQLNDKFLHSTGFIIMAILCHLAHPKTSQYYLVTGLSALGLGIELIQAYLPYRTFSLWDWMADIIGILFYFLLLARIVAYKLLPD